MISIQLAARCDLVRTESKPSNENNTTKKNPIRRLVAHYHHSLFMEKPNLQA